MRAAVLALLASCGRFGFDQGQATDAKPGVQIDAPTVRTAPVAAIAPVEADGIINPSITGALPIVAPGQLIVVAVGYDFDLMGPSVLLTSLTDTANDTFTILGPDQGGDGNRQYIGYGFTTATGKLTITATLNGTSNTYGTLRMHTYDHVDPLDPEDGHGADAAPTVTRQPGSTITTTTDHDTLFAFSIVQGGSATPAAGWTSQTFGDGDLTVDRVVAVPGAQTITMAVTGGKWTLSYFALRGR